jgi:hypothetical protein
VNDAPDVYTFGFGSLRLLDGVVCLDCLRLECTGCKGDPLDAPCQWCGKPVSPAHEQTLDSLYEKATGIQP